MKAIVIFASLVSFFAVLGRTVLGSAPTAASTQFTRLQFKGTAQAPEVYGGSYPIVTVSASGSGTATEFGQFTLLYKAEMDMTDLSTVEAAQFVGLNGSSVVVTGVGQAMLTTTPSIFNLVQVYKVSGGTGRFAGAKGTITLSRIVNMASGLTYSTFDGYILVPSQNR